MVNGLSFVLKYANKSSFSVPGSPTKKTRRADSDLDDENIRSYEEEKVDD